MTFIEKGYFYKIRSVIGDFIESNINHVDIDSIHYASYWFEEIYIKKPLEDEVCTNETLFKASITLKLYKAIIDTENKVIEVFGNNALLQSLLREIFRIVDFENK